MKNSIPVEDPEVVAIDALGFIAADATLLRRFLDLTGFRLENLRDAAMRPNFLPAVLDFLLGHEPTLLTFAEKSGRSPDAVPRARQALAKANKRAVSERDPSRSR